VLDWHASVDGPPTAHPAGRRLRPDAADDEEVVVDDDEGELEDGDYDEDEPEDTEDPDEEP
jgi:hypothetical protein